MVNRTYIIDFCAKWIAEYSTWSELKNYLTSEAGGKLVVLEGHGANVNRAIIRYDKGMSDMTREDVRWARSIVWNCETNRPLSIATPKASNATVEQLVKNMSDISQEYQIEEYYEGVTMNLYRDGPAGSKFKIATRTKFGAVGKFYSKRSFADLFNEALKENPIDNNLDGNDFMSIILQHPEHRIVSRIATPKWITMHRGRIQLDGRIEITECVPELSLEDSDQQMTFQDWFNNKMLEKGWQWQGICIKDGKGNRFRQRSTIYRLVRDLKGNTPRLDERFFNLRNKGLVKTYLTYYPEDKQSFWEYESWLRNSTDQVFNLYCGVYKEHSKDFTEVERKFQPHLSAIHAQYLGSLKADGKTVNMAVVRDYMNNLPVPRLLFLMNFDKRDVKQPISQKSKKNRGAAGAVTAETV